MPTIQRKPGTQKSRQRSHGRMDSRKPAVRTLRRSSMRQRQPVTASYPVPVATKQFLSTVAAPTVATPSNIKQLIPVTTATTTQHHGKGVSYSTFTQQANAASLGHQQNQSPYYNVVQPHQYQQQQPQQQINQQAQQQQQQQPTRFQVYSTVATPLHKPALLYQYAHQPSIPAAFYATAASPLQQFQQQQPQQSSPFHYGSQLYHPQPPLQQQQQQQQPQPYAQLAKLSYSPGAASLQKGFYPVQ